MTEADSITVHKVDAVPIRWAVKCPCCGGWVETEDMQDGISAGTFFHGDEYGNPFLSCECGAVLEPRSMRLETV